MSDSKLRIVSQSEKEKALTRMDGWRKYCSRRKMKSWFLGKNERGKGGWWKERRVCEGKDKWERGGEAFLSGSLSMGMGNCVFGSTTPYIHPQ